MWLNPAKRLLRTCSCLDIHLTFRGHQRTAPRFPLYSFVSARYYGRLQKKVRTSEVRRGKKIKTKTVRLIDETGNNLGIMDTVVAVLMAQGKGMELVQVTNDDQPVCKLMSKKQIWEESKNLKEKNKKDPTTIVKEVQIMVGISENDLKNKIKAIIGFLERSHPVKLWIQVKRHQRSLNSHNDQESLLKLIMSNIKDFGTEKDVVHSSRGLSCVLKSTNDKNKGVKPQ